MSTSREHYLPPAFAEISRRHPDVDLALRPPVDRRPPDEPTPLERCREVVAATSAAVAWVEGVLDADAGPRRDLWWPCGDRGLHRYVVRAAFSCAEPGDPSPQALLDAVRAHLAQRRGGPVAAITGDSAVLDVDGPDATLRLRATARSLAVRVTSTTVRLDAATQAALSESEEATS